MKKDFYKRRDESIRAIRSEKPHAYGLGMPIILVVFAVLSVITLAVISLMTSRGELRNEQESLRDLKEVSEAENRAEEKRLEADLMLRSDPEGADEKVTYIVSINDHQDLFVTLQKPAQPEKGHYDVTGWKIVNRPVEEGEATRQGIIKIGE